MGEMNTRKKKTTSQVDAERSAKWERNRARRKMMTDEQALEAVTAELISAGVYHEVYLNGHPTPRKGQKVISISRSHMRRTYPCRLTVWERFEIPGFGVSSSSVGVGERGRTWEHLLVEVRRALREGTLESFS